MKNSEKSRVQKITKILQKLYPDPKPSLDFKTPFELLVAAMLAAQCTDKRVNIVTAKLFPAANTPEKILKLGEKKLMEYVKPTGFFRAKTKNLMGCAKMLAEKFSGKMPRTLEDLQKLPGVGRKTASVILAQAFGIPAFPVDRHVLRVANRLGLADAKTPDQTADQLQKNLPKNLWIPLHMRLVYLGREICRPKPKCSQCALLTNCPAGKTNLRKK